jgi:nucleotide-binding universal stress UspA family protein
MSYADILLHIDPVNGDEASIAVAVDLAEQHRAHLAGLASVADIYLPLYGFTGLAEDVYRQMDQVAEKRFTQAKTAFDSATANFDISTEFRPVKVDGATVAETVALHGRHADLIVTGQTNPEKHRTGGPDMVEQLILAAGRPVLVVPFTGAPQNIGRNVIVGWDGSREAARALSDALPLISQADVVNVMVINPDRRREKHGELPGADISTHLARHGLNVNLAVENSDTVDPANLILSRAADLNADLLVIGAFGHSRLKQSLFGGVTRSMLEQMTLPVLMSH